MLSSRPAVVERSNPNSHALPSMRCPHWAFKEYLGGTLKLCCGFPSLPVSVKGIVLLHACAADRRFVVSNTGQLFAATLDVLQSATLCRGALGSSLLGLVFRVFGKG